MKTAERAGRFICAAAAATGFILLILPLWGIRVNVVLSGSMEPAIPTGGIVFTDTRQTAPCTGDIITYRLGETTVTHRVVRTERGSYITRGDANDGEDASPVAPSQVVGTVVFCLPRLGYAVAFLQKRTVFCLLLLVIVQEMIFFIIQRKGERGRKPRRKTI